MNQLIQDLRFTIRVLAKHRGFTLVAVLTLALAIGANSTAFNMVNAVVLRPLSYPQSDRLMMLWERNTSTGGDLEKLSGPDLLEWQSRTRSFEGMARWTSWSDNGGINLVESDSVEKVNVSFVSANLFPLLRATPLLGRTFVPDEDKYEGERAAVISYSLWQRKFAGAPDIVGRKILTDSYGRHEYTIVGAMPDKFDFPNHSELWLPVGWAGVHFEERRSGHWYQVLARLNEGVSVESAQAELGTIQQQIHDEHPDQLTGSSAAVVPLLDQTIGRNLRRILFTLWGIVACILLIGCTNLANLMLAQAASRRKEIALRFALGASRGRVIRQLLTESLLLGLLGGTAGMLLSIWANRLIVITGAEHVERLHEVQTDTTVLLFTFAISALTGLLFGIAPAIILSKTAWIESLKDCGRTLTAGAAAVRLRASLMVAEIALSLALLVGAGLMINSFLKLSRLDHGFTSEHLLTAKLDFSVAGFTTWVEQSPTRPQATLRQILRRLDGQPGIVSVAMASKLPQDIGSALTQTIYVEGQPTPPTNEMKGADFQAVSPDYFRTMGIALLRGRVFTEADDIGSTDVAIVNETFAARYLPGQDVIGKRISMLGRQGGDATWIQIVGLAHDVRNLNTGAETMPVVYRSYTQWPMQSPTLLVRTVSDPASVSSLVREAVRESNSTLPAPVLRSMDGVIATSVAEPRFYTMLCAIFGSVALLLAISGIYGTISYSVAGRTHEFGVRMALGANRETILRLVLAQGVRLIVVGIVLGLLLSTAVTRVIASQLFGISPTDPATFTIVSIILMSAALLACMIPAMRATRVDPTVALRHD